MNNTDGFINYLTYQKFSIVFKLLSIMSLFEISSEVTASVLATIAAFLSMVATLGICSYKTHKSVNNNLLFS